MVSARCTHTIPHSRTSRLTASFNLLSPSSLRIIFLGCLQRTATSRDRPYLYFVIGIDTSHVKIRTYHQLGLFTVLDDFASTWLIFSRSINKIHLICMTRS